jgi:hypothetical protein
MVENRWRRDEKGELFGSSKSAWDRIISDVITEIARASHVRFELVRCLALDYLY